MATKLHSAVAGGSRHPIHQLTYPDAANRIAGTNEGTGATPKDFDVAKQDDDDSLWLLTDSTGPTWYQIAGPTMAFTDLTLSGDLAVGGSITLTAGGMVTTTAAGNITFAPDTTGILIAQNSLRMEDDIPITFGDSDDSGIRFSTVQATSNATLFCVDTTSRSLILTSKANVAKDHDHAAQTNPTLFIHSAKDPDTLNTEWISLSHNQTNAVIQCGTGALVLGSQTSSHSVASNGDLVANKIEANARIYADNGIESAGHYRVIDDFYLLVGSSDDAAIGYNTLQGSDCLFYGVDATSNTLLVCQITDQNYNFSHSNESNPTIFVHSANQSTTEWTSISHNQTDAVDGIGKGSKVTFHSAPRSVADDGTFNLPTSSSGFGFFQAGDGEEWGQISWNAAGTVTLIANSANTVTTDTDTKFCIISGANPVVVKNRLGSAKEIMFNYHYTT